jgi:hypothetical protein
VESFGPVMSAPKFVPIFFANDTPSIVTQATAFYAGVGATSYWQAVTSEYGVGPVVSSTPVNLLETPSGTIDDTQIQSWLINKFNDPTFPQPDQNTLYIVNYPSSVTVSMAGGAQGTAYSCQEFGGYHSDFTLSNGLDVAYAVVPRCNNFGNLSGIDDLTGAGSHEIIEAVTDPFPNSNTPGYAEPDEAHIFWLLALGGGEVGDMCAQNPDAFTKFPGFPFTVQRSWSNKAAASSHNPCQPPVPGTVYFNSVPEENDDIVLNLGQTITMKGNKIPLGQTKTINLDLFSEGDTGGPWSVKVMDGSALMGGAPGLDLSLNKNQGQNGEKLQLTITALKASQYKVEVYYIISTSGQSTNLWVGLVGN